MSKISFQSIIFTALFYVLSGLAVAQTATAALSGTVVDENGAVVANAALKITDAARF